MTTKPFPTTLTGAAGEHFVIYRLLKLGYLAGLAPQGAPNADIIATNTSGEQVAAIQVKTRRPIGADAGWHMKAKHEDILGKNLFYCFVDLPNNEQDVPVIYILPSIVVAKALKETHEVWLNTPGKNGKKHNPTDMRRLLPDYRRNIYKPDHPVMKNYGSGWLDKYKENWEGLGLG